jgi:predicted nucleic acid-binding protein
MLLVVDADILVGQLTNRAGRRLVFHSELQLVMTAQAWEETKEHLTRRLRAMAASGKTPDWVIAETVAAIAQAEILVQRVPADVYADFMGRARRVMPDPDDVPTVALALAMGAAQGSAAIWTKNKEHFWGCGLPVWSTERLRPYLPADESHESADDQVPNR